MQYDFLGAEKILFPLSFSPNHTLMPKIQHLEMNSFDLTRGFVLCYKAHTPERSVWSLFHHLNHDLWVLTEEEKPRKSEEILGHQEGQH